MNLQKHNPARFVEFEEFRDRTGFSIHENGRDIEFFFDSERGWFDEHGNYYNRKGQPSTPNHQSEAFWHGIKHNYSSHEDDDVSDLLDEYEQDFNTNDDEEDQDLLQRAQIQEQVQHLLEILGHYGAHNPIKVYFNGVRARCTEDQVKGFFGQGVTEVHFETRGKFKTGKGYLVVVDREAAKRVVWKHRQELEGQEVTLDVEALVDAPSDEEETHVQTQAVPVPPRKVKQTVAVVQIRLPLEPFKQESIKQVQIKKPAQPQRSSYDIVFSNVPATESVESFTEWMRKYVDETWNQIRNRLDDSKKTQQFKLHFDSKRDAEELHSYFIHNREKLMFKGRNRLTVTKDV